MSVRLGIADEDVGHADASGNMRPIRPASRGTVKARIARMPHRHRPAGTCPLPRLVLLYRNGGAN
jgi:hypothetical protein